MVLPPRRLSDGDDAVVIAQFLVAKITTFFGAEPRILTVSASHLTLYNPRNFNCTNQWFLGDITDIHVPVDPDQFILMLEQSRFRSSRLHFQCGARSHLLALVSKLRRHFSLESIRLHEANNRPQFQCTEHFADDSYDHFVMHVGAAAITLVDEHGRKVAQFPYVNLQRIAQSTAHPDGLVLSTLFQERLFLVHPRDECIGRICAATQALGIHLPVHQSPLNMQLLRLRNSQALDQPSVVCFDVAKAVGDGGTQHIQLIFQGAALLEVHRKLRIVVTRPYRTLLCVMHSEWDADTAVLQFLHGEDLVVQVESRDQFIAMLLLVCREAGNHHVELAPASIPKNRLFHPHMTENVRQSAAPTLETFLLRRIVHAASNGHDDGDAGVGELRWPRLKPSTKSNSNKKKYSTTPSTLVRPRGGRSRHPRHRGLRVNPVIREAHLSVDTGVTINDHMTLSIVMEEFNANLPLGSGLADHATRLLLDKTMSLLVDHLATLTATLRAYVEASSGDVVITLQALARLAQSPHTFIDDEQVPQLLNALHDLLQRQHFLTCYWVLKLLQSYFEPRKHDEARRHRAKALEHFVENRQLLFTVLALIPSTSSLSAHSSGRWMRSGGASDTSSDAFMRQNLDETLLFTQEERLEKDMNILTYEALFTLHHVLIFLQTKEKYESELAATALLTNQSTKPKHWTETIELDDQQGDYKVHQRNYTSAVVAKREIGDRLLTKYKFLMDAVVDVRLQRASQTIVALIAFLVHFFADHNHAHQPNNEDGDHDDDSHVYRIGSERDGEKDENRYRRSEPLRRSSLDDVADANEDAKLRRQLDELDAFLQCYKADVATLDDRSRLFREQPTILLPLFTFSQASSTESSGNSFFRLSDASMAVKHDDDCMTLDQLVESKHAGQRGEENHEEREMRPSQLYAPASRPRQAMQEKPKPRVLTRPQPIDDPPPLQTQPTSSLGHRPRLKVIQEHKSQPRSSDSYSVSDTIKSDSVPSSTSFQPTFMRSSNFRRLDDTSARATKPKQRRETQSERGVDHVATTISSAVPLPHQRIRPASTAMIDRRLTAHVCDACIACNDVCGGDNCFFCAEKEFQLRRAFGSSSASLPLATSNASSSSGERKYSTCEVRRHQDKRSCWVLVAGVAYDVTDLLSSHPGGADVLLTAAQNGEDCAELFLRRHPFAARRVLESFRKGDVYYCETRTLLH